MADTLVEAEDRIKALALHAIWRGRASTFEVDDAVKDLVSKARALGGERCAIQDCPNRTAVWMTSTMAPGRPLVYGVCEKDAALIELSEVGEP